MTLNKCLLNLMLNPVKKGTNGRINCKLKMSIILNLYIELSSEEIQWYLIPNTVRTLGKFRLSAPLAFTRSTKRPIPANTQRLARFVLFTCTHTWLKCLTQVNSQFTCIHEKTRGFYQIYGIHTLLQRMLLYLQNRLAPSTT